MPYVTYLLVGALRGNSSPRTKNIHKILNVCVNRVLGELNRKNTEDIISEGIRNAGQYTTCQWGYGHVYSPWLSSSCYQGCPTAAEEKKTRRKRSLNVGLNKSEQV